MDKGRLVFHTYRTLGRAIAAVPEPVALGAAALVGDVISRVRPGQRAMVAQNLRRALGPAVTEREVGRRTHLAYRAYVRYWVEGARLSSTPPAEIVRRFTVESGFEHLVAGMEAGKGVVLALPHLGSWEHGGAYLAIKGYPMTAVAERIEPAELFDYFVQQRAAMGLTVVPLGAESGGAVLRTLRQGGLVGLVCDRDLVGNGVEVELFGERTTMPAGPATLALRTGAALITGAVYSGPGRDHRGVVGPPVDTTRTGSLRADVQRITQEIATRFEQAIRRAPEQWHVFQPVWPVDRGGRKAAHAPTAGAARAGTERTGVPSAGAEPTG